MTLPGIAGIVLTVGMAVDANVIIFERVREELRNGESARKAISLGYDRAYWSILDANITTGLAAVVMMEFGSGPVQGFAVTLLIGIITSVFTAIFVTRLIFDWWLTRFQVDRLSV
jgi:preprotein translocase subunit SecD